MDIVFSRRGEGPPLVLMHGIGHRRQAWDPVLDLLASERDVIALDLPGFGESPPLPPGSAYTLDAAVTRMAGLLADLGLDRPHVAGNSLGGLLALEAARRGLVSSATALSPAGFFTPSQLRYAATTLRALRAGAGLPEPLMRRLARTPRMRRLMFGAIYHRPELLPLQSLIDDSRAMRNAAGFEPTLRAGGVGTTFTGPITGVPVTIAWGTHDRLLTRSQAFRAQRVLPEATFLWLPGCGHVPMGDDPALVAKVLLRGSET